MSPNAEEIKDRLPECDRAAQIVFIDESEAIAFGLVRTLVVRIGKFWVKVFQLSTLKKVVFIVLVALSALEGIKIELCILKNEEIPILMERYRNKEEWAKSIKTNQNLQNQNKYFAFVYPPSPTPTDETFFQEQNKILAPISGSMNVMQNGNYQDWTPNKSIDGGIVLNIPRAV